MGRCSKLAVIGYPVRGLARGNPYKQRTNRNTAMGWARLGCRTTLWITRSTRYQKSRGESPLLLGKSVRGPPTPAALTYYSLERAPCRMVR